MSENKVFFIINKYSGKDFQSNIEGRIIDACARLRLECTIEYTQHKGHATALAQQAVSEGYSRVFAMGGDGTVNEVAQALVHTSVALGILPKGSGNGLARHLQIPLETYQALHLLEKNQVIAMDTLRINGKLSVNVSGIGFDAHVASKFGGNGKRGLMGYVRLVLKEFNRFREFEVTATCAGASWGQKVFIIALANSSQFGNNARVAPHASVCDGQMEICLIRKVPLSQALGFAVKMFTGRIGKSSFVTTIKTSHFRAEFPKPVAYHIDGESHTPVRKLEVEMQPASLRVIVPAEMKGKY